MCCINYFNEKIKKLNVYDMTVMKICLFAFTLLVVKFWPVLTSLHWAWYAGVFAVSYAYLVWRFFFSK